MHGSTERLNSAVTCQTRSVRRRQDQKFWKDKSSAEVRGLSAGGTEDAEARKKKKNQKPEAEWGGAWGRGGDGRWRRSSLAFRLSGFHQCGSECPRHNHQVQRSMTALTHTRALNAHMTHARRRKTGIGLRSSAAGAAFIGTKITGSIKVRWKSRCTRARSPLTSTAREETFEAWGG